MNMSGHLIFMKVAVSFDMNVGVFVSWNDDSAPAQILKDLHKVDGFRSL